METINKIKNLKKEYELNIENIFKSQVIKIMNKHKNLVRYSDVMGLQVFTDKKGNDIFLLTSVYNGDKYIYIPTYKSFDILLDIYYNSNIDSFGIIINKE